MLRRKIAGIVAINPEGGKVSRVNAVSPAIESGNVWIPKYAPFTVPFIDQCSSFPSGKNDDMVDAMSQALNRFIFFGADVPKKTERDDFDLKGRIKSAKYNDAKIDRSFIDY
jgi:phage terminase large subunit-like protein